MPIARIITANCTPSTSAGNCRAARVYNLSAAPGTAGLYDDCNTARTAAVALTAGDVMDGFVWWYKKYGTDLGNVVFQLQEFVGGIWKDITIANGYPADANKTLAVSTFAAPFGIKLITFNGSFTKGANNVQIRISSQFSGQIWWARSSTAGDYAFATYDNSDTATGVTSGDTPIVLDGITYTADAAQTYAAINSRSLFVGDGGSWLCPNPGSNITIAWGGGVVQQSSTSTFKYGTSATPITGGRVTITSSATAATVFHDLHYLLYDYINNGNTYVSSPVIEYWGATSDTPRMEIGAAAGGSNVSGQKKVTFDTAIPVTWAVNDVVKGICKDKNNGDSVRYTIASIDSTTQITLNANLDANLVTGGWLVNISEAQRVCGITFNSTNRILFGLSNSSVAGSLSSNGYVNHMNVQGVYANRVDLIISPNTTDINTVDGWYGDNTSTSYGYVLLASDYGTSTFNNIFIMQETVSYIQPICRGTLTMSNCGFQGCQRFYTDGGFLNNASVFNKVVWANDGAVGTWPLVYFAGYGNTYNDVRVIGGQAILEAASSTFNGGFQRTNSAGYGTIIRNAPDTFYNDFTFGVGTGNVTADVYHETGKFSKIICNNCFMGGRGISTNIQNTNPGSYMRFHNWNATDGDHRTFSTKVNFTTDSPSYSNLVQTQTNTSDTGEHVFELNTGNIAGKTFTFTTDCLVSSNYDDGTYTWPKVDIYYDDNPTTGTPDATVSATAVGTNPLSVTFTPTTNKKKVRLAFRSKTNTASTTVKWSNAHIYTAIWSYDIVDLPLDISETITAPATIGVIAAPVANPFITLTEVQAAALSSKFTNGTDFEWNDDGTMSEAYQYSEYLKIQTITMTKIFETVDNNSFTGSKGVTIDSGKVASGTSTQRLDIGSNTLTATGDDYSDGLIITDVAGTHSPLLLTGLVSGSTVYLHNDTDASTILKATVAATTKQKMVTLSGDKTISGRVDYCVGTTAYIPFSISAQTIGINGLTIPIAQRLDTAYNDNAINGSTITQVTLSGSNPNPQIDDTDNTIPFQEIYAAYRYLLSTTSYIDIQSDRITGQTALDFLMDATIELYNADLVNTLTVTGANVGKTGGGDPVDSTGGRINFRASRAGTSGSEVATAVWSDTSTYGAGTKGEAQQDAADNSAALL